MVVIGNKIECFSFKGGCGIRGHTRIGAFKKEQTWAPDKRLGVISNIMLFELLRN